MKKAANVLTIGGATQDVFIYYENMQTSDQDNQAYILLEQGSKIDVTDLHYYSGGGATNAAVAFTRLGFTTSSFFKIGKDSQGEFILVDLKKENINLDNIVYSTMQTGMSFVIPPPNGDRVILAFRGANKDLKENEIPYNQIKNSNQLYITSLTGDSSKLIEPITDFARKNNISVACNPGLNQLKNDPVFIRSLKNIDILNMNTTEATEFMKTLNNVKFAHSYPSTSSGRTGWENENLVSDENIKYARDENKNPDHPACSEYKNCARGELVEPYEQQNFPKLVNFVAHFAKTVLPLGPSIIVITNGAEGVYVADKKNIYFHPSIPPEKFVNTLGAGDSFGSCFVASILHGESIEQSMVNGTLNSSSVICYEGAKAGLLTLEELNKRAKAFGLSKIQKFDY